MVLIRTRNVWMLDICVVKLICKAGLAEQTIDVTVFLGKNTQDKLGWSFGKLCSYLLNHIIHPFHRRMLSHLRPLLTYSMRLVHFLQIKLVELYQNVFSKITRSEDEAMNIQFPSFHHIG